MFQLRLLPSARQPSAVFIFIVACLLVACDSASTTESDEIDPASMNVFQLTNADGLSVSITNFGGKVISLNVPDRNGEFSDVVLGYDSASQYHDGNPYYGALIGRYGNRIAKGTFTIGKDTFRLAANNGINALHGGPGGFHNVIWKASPFEDEGQEGVELTYESADGEEGYPGTLVAVVRYLLNDNNELVIDYEARTSKPTVVNLTHHSFFNLRGEGNGDILSHQFELFADHYLPVDSGLIPLGHLAAVDSTPFDFKTPHTAGERIGQDHEQLKLGKGYDHCWVLRKESPDALTLAARVTEPVSGRIMEVFTTEPGLQFYSGNFLTGKGQDVGKQGKPYPFRSAFCLEAQHYPDSPNRPEFPSTLLKPGQTYRQRTIYKFSTR